jgi:hypothetical protein
MKKTYTVKYLALAVVCGLAVFVCPPAQASFVSIGATPVGVSAGHGPPDFVWSLLPPDATAKAQAVLTELFTDDLGGEYDVSISGVTDGDPILQVTKDITNSTSYTWIGYSILLDPLDTDTFVGVPTSDGTSGGMTLVNQTAYSLDWGTPNAVQPGQTVTFTFQVNVPDTGPFGFTLTQMPTIQEFNIPEPATISLIGLAVLMVVGIGRRRFQ